MHRHTHTLDAVIEREEGLSSLQLCLTQAAMVHPCPHLKTIQNWLTPSSQHLPGEHRLLYSCPDKAGAKKRRREAGGWTCRTKGGWARAEPWQDKGGNSHWIRGRGPLSKQWDWRVSEGGEVGVSGSWFDTVVKEGRSWVGGGSSLCVHTGQTNTHICIDVKMLPAKHRIKT